MEDKQKPDRRVDSAPQEPEIFVRDSADRVPQPKGEFKNLFQGTPPKNEGGDKSSGDKGNSTK